MRARHLLRHRTLAATAAAVGNGSTGGGSGTAGEFASAPAGSDFALDELVTCSTDRIRYRLRDAPDVGAPNPNELRDLFAAALR